MATAVRWASSAAGGGRHSDELREVPLHAADPDDEVVMRDEWKRVGQVNQRLNESSPSSLKRLRR